MALISTMIFNRFPRIGNDDSASDIQEQVQIGRILRPVVVFCCLLSAMLVSIQFYSDWGHYKQGLKEHSELIEQQFKRPLQEALSLPDRTHLTALIQQMLAFDKVVAVEVRVPNSELYSMGYRSSRRSYWVGEFTLLLNSDEALPVGRVMVWGENRGDYWYLAKKSLMLFFMVLLQSFLVVAFVLLVVRNKIARRIGYVVESLSAVRLACLRLQWRMPKAKQNVGLQNELRVLERSLNEARKKLNDRLKNSRQSEIFLRKRLEEYRDWFDNSPYLQFVLNVEGRIIKVNRFGAAHLGYEEDSLLGQRFLLLQAEKASLLSGILSGNAINATSKSFKLRLKCRNGRLFWAKAWVRVLINCKQEQVFHCAFEDIQDEWQDHQNLLFHANHDTLTQLFNRRAFEEHFARSMREMPQTTRALLYLDLDHFKTVNDSCGHMAGDEVLKQVAQVLRQHLTEKDVLARLGGDEFALLVETSLAGRAEALAHSLCQAVAAHGFFYKGQCFRLGVSIGVVPIPPGAVGLEPLLEQADQACYRAKHQGRGQMSYYLAVDKGV